ncbi:MAG: hypothetical protein Kow00121_43620 [Elainellaceae cyanobacterium]
MFALLGFAFMLFTDARIYQILFLGLFLILGVSSRDWTLHPTIVGVTIATCLTTQKLAITISQAISYKLKLGRQHQGTKQHQITEPPEPDPTSTTKTPVQPSWDAEETPTLQIDDRRLNPIAQAFRLALGGSLYQRFSDLLKLALPFVYPLDRSLFSALITALGLSLLLRAEHYSSMILAAVLAIASKFCLRVAGKHIFNPANFGIIAALILTQDAWVSPGQWGEDQWYGLLFLGTGGIVLKQVGRWDTTAAFLATYAGLEAIRNLWLGWSWDVWLHRLMSGSLLLFALFMITDPRTTPNARTARLIWAGMLALLTFILRNYFFISTAAFWALFILAPLTILLDRLFPSAGFTWGAVSALAPVSLEGWEQATEATLPEQVQPASL